MCMRGENGQIDNQPTNFVSNFKLAGSVHLVHRTLAQRDVLQI